MVFPSTTSKPSDSANGSRSDSIPYEPRECNVRRILSYAQSTENGIQVIAMNQGHRQTRLQRSARRIEQTKPPDQSTANEFGEQRFLTVTGVAIILFCTGIIFGQTIKVPAIDYEDTFYLVRSSYVHVNPAFS